MKQLEKYILKCKLGEYQEKCKCTILEKSNQGRLLGGGDTYVGS